MKHPQAGFTLLEVVVAMTVVGAGFAVGLAAMSGSLRLMRSSGEYEQAMLLARAAMTEALAYPDYDIADDREREVYKGTEYAYRVEFRPVRLDPAGDARAAATQSGSAGTPTPLEQISVDVYWGEGRNRTYRLVTYRLRPSAPEAAQTRARGNLTPAGDGPAPSAAGSGSATGNRSTDTQRDPP